MKWSRLFSKCVDCGKTDKQHIGKGRCKRCYFKFKYKTSPNFKKRWKQLGKNWRSEHKEQNYYLNMKATFKLFLKKYPKEAKQIYEKER